ncbi:MAG: class F sortase [Thermocrispum agreste]|uniref:Class F sortase n=1 Tax=Thermocrispum agreste TaxID=37925 RepID=A0ABD6FCU2_9PSEU
MPGRRRRHGLVAAALALCLTAGCSSAASSGAERSQAPPSSPAQASEHSGRGEQARENSPRGMPPAPPVSVSIPRIGARSSLVPVGLNKDRTLAVPPVSQPMQAAWYRYSPTPGEVGPSVLLGHVDGGGKPGIFHRLHTLEPGDEVIVERADGSVARFVVRRVAQVPKKAFPTDEVYGDTDRPEIRLITCGGSFDRAAGSYRDNVIVYGTLKAR